MARSQKGLGIVPNFASSGDNGISNGCGCRNVCKSSDAAAATDPLLWLVGIFVRTSLVGCLFCGLPAIGIAYIHQPSPPVARLMGKFPEYVMLYTQTYKDKIRSHQVMDATIGCVGGSLVAALIWSRYYAGEWDNYW